MSNLEIVFENNDYIVVNKMAGLISEKNPFEDLTVEDQVLKHFSKSKPKPYVGVIHRLDRVTSGIILFAKKKSILVQFNDLFSRRKVQKTYLAIVDNNPPKNQDQLINYLVKNRLEKRADIVQNQSKEAVECVLSYEVLDQNDFGYLLKITPKTGRFHQIRAQLAHIGCPIIGDEKYGSDKEYSKLAVGLHAWKLTYPNLINNKLKTYEAPLPKNKFWTFSSFKG